ncbi:hypothetical protein BGW39_009849 [Mortierella sp. 14UC]|nr:hypothetical protein BGW39_009849 [Mortierella sp. 14UC]
MQIQACLRQPKETHLLPQFPQIRSPRRLAAVQLGPANLLNPLGHHVVGYGTSESDVLSVSSGKSSRFGFRKRFSALVYGDYKDEDTVPDTPPPQTPIWSGHCIHSAESDVEALSVASSHGFPSQPVDAGATTLIIPSIQVHASSMTSDSLSQNIFPKNLTPAAVKAPLPKPHSRIGETTQLVYCCQSLIMSLPYSAASNNDALKRALLDEAQNEWIQLTDPIEQDRLHWIVERLVRAFVEDEVKASAAVAEIVLVGPILEHEMYRSLLSCFIAQFEETRLLDVTLLHGLVQLVECASTGYLVDDDLVRISTVLFNELSAIHNGTSDHVLLLTLALGRVLDVMVAGKVKNLNRDRNHQPMLQLLDGLKGSDNDYLKYQAAYAYQALQYVPDDETPLQVVWRYSKMAAGGAFAVSSALKLDPVGLLQGIESLQKIGTSVIEAVKAGIDGYQSLREGSGTAVRATEAKFDYMKKRSWYLALQGTALFIRQGRFSDFKQIVTQAYCRHSANFQWGISRQLGEIAVDDLWDAQVREQAVDFLGELYKSSADWKPHVDVKR